jgi:hypothetical protein
MLDMKSILLDMLNDIDRYQIGKMKKKKGN